MRYAFLIPLGLAALIAAALPLGEARPWAPYAMTALLGAAWEMFRIRGEE